MHSGISQAKAAFKRADYEFSLFFKPHKKLTMAFEGGQSKYDSGLDVRRGWCAKHDSAGNRI